MVGHLARRARENQRALALEELDDFFFLQRCRIEAALSQRRPRDTSPEVMGSITEDELPSYDIEVKK